MKDYAHALQLENGELAILDFGQGTRVNIYPTKYIHLATLEQDIEDTNFFLEDFNKFLIMGTHGLFEDGGCVHQYHFKHKIAKVVKVKLSLE